MTILDLISREAKALPVEKRRVALELLRSIRTPPATMKKPVRKTLGQARSAISAAQGMWRNRADLPSDTLEASIELRRRMMRRAIND